MVYSVSWLDCALTGRYVVTWLPGARPQCWMLLTVYTLPQLAVSAKILCLLMVVICGAVPSMVRSMRLYNACSHMYVNVFPNGTVMARSNLNDQPNLTISTRGASLDLLLYSPTQRMYLCFNNTRLVGRRMHRFKAERLSTCLFKEEFVDGYNTYRLVHDKDRYIGFNRFGRQIKRPKRLVVQKYQNCFSFMKEAHSFDINKHNKEIAKWRPRKLRPCHARHSRHARRRHCAGA